MNTKMEILENIAINGNYSEVAGVTHHDCSITEAL